ncbi:MAG: hypothetical protein WA432_05070 [Candidatus Babeliaceae bacterium]
MFKEPGTFNISTLEDIANAAFKESSEGQNWARGYVAQEKSWYCKKRFFIAATAVTASLATIALQKLFSWYTK